jgi:hypothetical protein
MIILGDFKDDFEKIVNKKHVHVMYWDIDLLTKTLTKGCKTAILG